MTFGHHTFDQYASEEVRLFRTSPGPAPLMTDSCLDFFNEHKNKSLYPALGSSKKSIPHLAGMENATGLGATIGAEGCACVCYEDPECVAFHIHTENTNPNTPKRKGHCSFWKSANPLANQNELTEEIVWDKNSDDRPDMSYMGPGDEGHTAFDLVVDSYILRPESDIDIILAEREGDSQSDNGNGDVSDCPECPPNHMKAKSNGECTCISGEAIGKGLGTIGKGLGMLAIGGVVVTGIVVYGLYRVIRG